MWFAAILSAWSAAHAATVDFRLVVDRTVPADAVSFEVDGRWLDAPYTVRLTDEDGVRGDGIWSGRVSGEPARMLPVTLRMQLAGGASVVLASSMELLDVDGATITWAIDGNPSTGTASAHRVALAQSPRRMERFETAATAAGIGWFAVVFFYVAWWATERRSGGRTRRRGRG